MKGNRRQLLTVGRQCLSSFRDVRGGSARRMRWMGHVVKNENFNLGGTL